MWKLILLSAGIASAQTVLDGVYSAAQAGRGQAVYDVSCASCHKADLTGFSGPPLKGDEFLDRWREFNLDVLGKAIGDTMPKDNPGSLSEKAQVDLLAYLLQVNEIPPASKELAMTDLPHTLLLGKEGSKPLPSSSPVEVVGCLTLDVGNGWFLTSSNKPARTLDQFELTPKEVSAAKKIPLGDMLFRVLGVPDLPGFDREKLDGSKVDLKGMLILQPKNERINVTALEKLETGCEK